MLRWIPDLRRESPLRVLCLGAHSDDIEIGCGATLIQLALTFTLDVRWEVFCAEGNRAKEALSSACHWLNDVEQSKVELHSFRDGYFPSQWAEIKQTFEQIREEFSPDLIFTHCRSDLHQDHRVVHELTCNTFRDHAILEYEIPKYDGDLGAPNFYVPVDAKTARQKVEGLNRFFETQQVKHWFSDELFLGIMRIRGIEAGSDSGYAEGFYARKISWRL